MPNTWDKVIRWEFEGDKLEAQKLMGKAKNQLFQLKNIQSAGSSQFMLSKNYSDGSFINVRTDVRGMDIMKINVPSILGKKGYQASWDYWVAAYIKDQDSDSGVLWSTITKEWETMPYSSEYTWGSSGRMSVHKDGLIACIEGINLTNYALMVTVSENYGKTINSPVMVWSDSSYPYFDIEIDIYGNIWVGILLNTGSSSNPILLYKSEDKGKTFNLICSFDSKITNFFDVDFDICSTKYQEKVLIYCVVAREDWDGFRLFKVTEDGDITLENEWITPYYSMNGYPKVAANGNTWCVNIGRKESSSSWFQATIISGENGQVKAIYTPSWVEHGDFWPNLSIKSDNKYFIATTDAWPGHPEMYGSSMFYIMLSIDNGETFNRYDVPLLLSTTFQYYYAQSCDIIDVTETTNNNQTVTIKKMVHYGVIYYVNSQVSPWQQWSQYQINVANIPANPDSTLEWKTLFTGSIENYNGLQWSAGENISIKPYKQPMEIIL